ncbi:MAG: SUMF1/EgtB/PvdO family nonheme iron enzyme [Pirellulales bacterium]|nr:SUMF1/EgtB/PvdO family nonheme iron enzyme [Pirellulales bacterium]
MQRILAFLAWLLLVSFNFLATAHAQETGKKYAVLVGVEKYDASQLNRLNYTINDAEDLGLQLKSLGFDVTVMTQNADDTRLHPTTPEKIERVLTNRAKALDAADTLIFAFMGHGVQFAIDKENMANAEETQELYFCPADAQLDDRSTLLSLEKVYTLMQECQAGRKLLLVDACRNDPQPKGKTRAKEVELEPVGRKIRTVPQGMLAFFSCSPGEKAQEYPEFIDGRGHGAFTGHVLKYLRGEAGPDKYPQDELSLPEMVHYVQRETKDYVWNKDNADQIPVPYGKVASWSLGKVNSALKKEFTNSIGMKFALIPAGEFLMGSPKTEEGRDDGETQHRVKITKPFYLGAYEVTRGQFAKFVAETKYQTEAEQDGGAYGWDAEKQSFVKDEKFNWRTPGFTQADDHPVVCVSWNDAVAFCKWLEKKEKLKYTQPTEAQWEYACRAGTTTAFHFGDALNGTAANIDGNYPYGTETKGPYLKGTCKVGSYQPNKFGLFDMHGNAWEWCADWYDAEYYSNSPVNEPSGPRTGEYRVIRGGGWCSIAIYCRSANHNFAGPANRSDGVFGFRVRCIP